MVTVSLANNSVAQFISVTVIFLVVLAVTYFTTRWIGSYQKKHQKKSRDVRDKEPMSIYEVHLASWKKRIEDDDNGNFSYRE